ncbi:protein CREG1-like [Glandiceps talaboti]
MAKVDSVSSCVMHVLLVIIFADSDCNAASSLVVETKSEVRPPFTHYAERARYVVHQANWAVMNTISTQPGMKGYPFGNVASVSDGTVNNSTGIPYFYITALDVSVRDFRVNGNNNISLTFSETMIPDVNDCITSEQGDPENPLCTRLVLLGQMQEVTDSQETEFAKKALFSRHPVMPDWSSSHKFLFFKLDIKDVWMIDFFGGGKHITPEDYFKAKP